MDQELALFSYVFIDDATQSGLNDVCSPFDLTRRKQFQIPFYFDPVIETYHPAKAKDVTTLVAKVLQLKNCTAA